MLWMVNSRLASAEMGFVAGLESLQQLVQNFGDLVHAVALVRCFWEDLTLRSQKSKAPSAMASLGSRLPRCLRPRRRVDQDLVDFR